MSFSLPFLSVRVLLLSVLCRLVGIFSLSFSMLFLLPLCLTQEVSVEEQDTLCP